MMEKSCLATLVLTHPSDGQIILGGGPSLSAFGILFFVFKGKSRFLLPSLHFFLILYLDNIKDVLKTWKGNPQYHIIAKQLFSYIHISFEFLFISRYSLHKIATKEYTLFYWVAFYTYYYIINICYATADLNIFVRLIVASTYREFAICQALFKALVLPCFICTITF